MGSISDLQFLNDENIGVVDVSNIPDYFILNFKMNSRPWIINTTQSPMQTTYYSEEFSFMNEEEVSRLDQLIESVKYTMNSGNGSLCIFNSLSILSMLLNRESRDYYNEYYSKKLLSAVEELYNSFIIENGCGGWLGFGGGFFSMKDLGSELNKLTIEQLKHVFTSSDFSRVLTRSGKRVLGNLVSTWEELPIEKYAVLFQIEGFGQAFSEESKNLKSTSFAKFRENLEQHRKEVDSEV